MKKKMMTADGTVAEDQTGLNEEHTGPNEEHTNLVEDAQGRVDRRFQA